MPDFSQYRPCAIKRCLVKVRANFWRLPLHTLDASEWEALCDGCGLCCLIKFENDDGSTDYTDVACRLLDTSTGKCSDYVNRRIHVPDCISLKPKMLKKMPWLPATCAYKRRYLGQDIPPWHYLVAGIDTHNAMIARIGAGGRCVSENTLDDNAIETRIVRWVAVH